MSRNYLLRASPWLDVLLLVATLAPAAWMATRGEADLEQDFALCSTQWQRELDKHILRLEAEADASMGQRARTARERYAEVYPRSPLSRINQIPAVRCFWNACARGRERALPFLTVASVGIGLVAIRRPRRLQGRARWGLGRAAAAVAAVFCSVSIAEQFVLRRYNLIWYADYHDTLFHSWQQSAQQVGIAIAVSWVLLIGAGRWRGRRGWRDRLGLGLGVAWLVNLFWVTVLEPLAQF